MNRDYKIGERYTNGSEIYEVTEIYTDKIGELRIVFNVITGGGRGIDIPYKNIIHDRLRACEV